MRATMRMAEETGGMRNVTGRMAGCSCVSGAVEEAVPMLPAHSLVLDAGCGAGDDAFFMMKMGLDVTAIDKDAGAVALLKERMLRQGGRVEAFVADLREFIFIRMFRFVNMQFVLHEVPRSIWRGFREEAMRHTAPGGIHAVSVITGRQPAGGAADEGVSFEEGELGRLYDGWDILRYDSSEMTAITERNDIRRYTYNSITAVKPVMC